MAGLLNAETYDATHQRHMSRLITRMPEEGLEPPTRGL
jgi:hypothetical protein